MRQLTRINECLNLVDIINEPSLLANYLCSFHHYSIILYLLSIPNSFKEGTILFCISNAYVMSLIIFKSFKCIQICKSIPCLLVWVNSNFAPPPLILFNYWYNCFTQFIRPNSLLRLSRITHFDIYRNHPFTSPVNRYKYIALTFSIF